ncbi:hypothetical protein ABPG72_006252 [Tetrahymena utriculariae]
MGNQIMGNFRKARYKGFTDDQVNYLKDKFSLMCDDKGFLDANKLKNVYKCDFEQAKRVFEFLDMEGSGTVDFYKFTCGSAILCQSPLKETASLLYDIFNIRKKDNIAADELKLFVRTYMQYSAFLDDQSIQEEDIDNKTKALMKKWDLDRDGQLSIDEWEVMLQRDPDLKFYMHRMGFITRAEMGYEDDQYEDCDSDLEIELDRKNMDRDERIEKIKNGIEHNEKGEGDDADQFESEVKEKGDQFRANDSWKICKNFPPSSYQQKKSDSEAPKASLDLDYVHGYRCHDARNNLKFGPGESIIYHTAAVGIKLDPKSNKQQFNFEHNDDITCLDISQDGERVVTGQVGAKPLLCVWNATDMSTLVVFSGDLLKGIGNCCISPDGRIIAANALDDYHTVCVYDVDGAIAAKKDINSKTSGLVSSGRCTRAEILHLKFHPTEKLIIAACMKEVQFITYGGKEVKCQKGVWGKQSPQAVMAVTFVNNDCITGMFNGNIFTWQGQTLGNVIKAHNGPCTSITNRKKGNGFITGGKNGDIMIWNESYKCVATLNIQECFSAKLPQIKVISLCENSQGDLLVGLRGSEVILISKGDKTKAAILNQGHYDQELWGLAVHPDSKSYFTSGEDKLLCKFDVSSRKIISKTVLQYASKTLAISPDAKYLAVGMKNGLVLILDPKSLSEIAQIKEFINPDKDLVSYMKFSPDSKQLLVAYSPPISNVLGFDVPSFKKKYIMKGSPSRISSIDFSTDGTAIQLNNTSYEILHFSTSNGVQEKSGMTKFRDEKWATWNLTLGWPTQGIWPPCTSGDDINSVDRTPSGDILATADDFSKIKLFKFPCPIEKSSFTKYNGHSSHVTNVKFTQDEKRLISTGGEEKSVFQWKFQREQVQNQQQEEEEPQEEEDDGLFGEAEVEKGDQALAVKAFLGEVKNSTPSNYQPNPKKYNVKPDGDISLDTVHGYRHFYIKDECRDMVKYSNDYKSIVYPAAAVGVKQEKKLGGQQKFFIKHVEDIVSFSIHPTRTVAATGQMAAKGAAAKCIDLFVWDVNTMEIKAHFNEFHRRAIVLTSFSPNGQLLLSVGQDDDNSLAIHEWQAKRLVTTSPVDKAKITAVIWKSGTEFVTTGFKVVKFWVLNGRNVKGTNGSVGGAKFVSQFCGVYVGQTLFTGSGEGQIFSWNGSAGVEVKGAKHDKKVQSIIYDQTSKCVFTGAMDGKILKWQVASGTLKSAGVYYDLNTLDSPTKFQYKCGVTSIDTAPDGNMLVATSGGEIYEISGKNCNLLLQSHYENELWGLAVSPTNQNLYITSGGDKTIRLWDIKRRRMITSTKPMKNDVKGVHWGVQNGKEFVVAGDDLGFVYLLNPQTLEVLATHNSSFTKQKARQSTYWIEDIKISPDGTQVAFGAHGGASKLEIVKVEGGQKFGSSFEINCGLTSALLHVDWSVDSTVCVVNSQAYELKFVSIPAKKNMASSAAKDIEFASWTCKIGFPVQGVFQGVDYTDVNAVCRSSSGLFLASGNDDSQVKLFKYPVVVEKQVHKGYYGHSSHVTRVRFTIDDSYLISTGGNDKCVMVWKTTFGVAGKQSLHSMAQIEESKNNDNDIDVPVQKKKPKGAEKFAESGDDENQQEEQSNEMFGQEDLDKGDEFMAVKPWLGAIKEPSYKYFKDKKQFEEPPITINPYYVFGIRTKDQRGNLRYTASGKIVYNAAALGIVLDIKNNTQTFFNKHTDDIISLDLHPDGNLVATGEIGPKPFIYIWDSETKEVKNSWKGAILKGIACLAFSPSGNKLVAAAINDDHQIGVFDLKSKAVMAFKGGPEVIVDCDWVNEDNFVTVGVKHFKLWAPAGKAYKETKGDKTNFVFSGLAFINNQTLVGTSTGDLQVWQGNSFTRNSQDKKLHAKGIETIRVDQDYVFTGGKDCIVNILGKDLKVITSINVAELFPETLSGEVRSICPSQDMKRIIVATLACEIIEFEASSVPYKSNTKFSFRNCYMKGHFSPNLKWTNEVWGLSVFPNTDTFATCSDDGTLRIWSLPQRKQLALIKTTLNKDNSETPRDSATGDFADSVKGRAVAVSPEGNTIVVGFKEGTLKEFSVNGKGEDMKLVQAKVVKHAQRWISDIKFSPDGTTLVAGAHDQTIYAYNLPDWKPRCKPMKKHSSYITHIDFSRCGNYLHSTCGAYELLFWETNTGKQLTSGASALKDELWATWNVTLGWPVQGIWPECADGTDINAVDRSNFTIAKNKDIEKSYHLLATGDDFSHVRILRFPSLKKSSKGVIGYGHSSHVTNVKWTKDDEYIYSTGGEDQCVIIWKVDKK